jgi:hypothetical protein
MKAAILYKTDDLIDCNRTNIREQIDDILSDPNNFQLIDFIDTHDGFFSMLHKSLNNQGLGVSAVNIWENKNTLYAGYFVDVLEIINQSNDKDVKDIDSEDLAKIHKNIKLNIFGSQISSQNVSGNLIIVKQNLSYDIQNNNVKTITSNASITQNELTDMIENLIVKHGIVLNVDGSMSQYQYIMNPMEHLMLTDPEYNKNYIYHEYEIYTHVIIIIADIREINGKINHSGSFLAGNPVNGTVFIALYKKPDFNDNPPYISIDVDILKNILSLRQRSSSLTTGMTNSEKEYINFEKLLEIENIKHSDKPLLDITQITGELLNVK